MQNKTFNLGGLLEDNSKFNEYIVAVFCFWLVFNTFEKEQKILKLFKKKICNKKKKNKYGKF